MIDTTEVETIFLDMDGNFFLYYIQLAPETYLHSDGVIRGTTQNDKNEVSGFYTTMEVAERTLTLFKHEQKFKRFLTRVDEVFKEDEKE